MRLFFSYFQQHNKPTQPNPVIPLEQNIYKQCPVCGFPLSGQNAICPRCGNDILEDINTLDEQNPDNHFRIIEEKKADWYIRCLAENLDTGKSPVVNFSNDYSGPMHSGFRHRLSPMEQEALTASRAVLLRDPQKRINWFKALGNDWKEVVRNTMKIQREPSDEELLDFLNTTNIRCDNMRIHNLAPVGLLENLQQLRCDETPVESLEPLRHLRNLKRLYAFDCDYTSLDPLRDIVSLKLLWISSTEVSDLEPISALVNLEELYCSETLISDLSPLAGLVNLEKLSCYKTGISSIEPLRNLENLIELGINNTHVSSLEPLAGLDNLEYLRCSRTGITSLEPLRNLVSLKELSIEQTAIHTLEPLSGLEELEELSITGTLVDSIAPLMDLQNLEKLELSAGRILQSEIDHFMQLNPACNVVIKP